MSLGGGQKENHVRAPLASRTTKRGTWLPQAPRACQAQQGLPPPIMAKWKAWWRLGARVLRSPFSKQISSPKYCGLRWLLCSEWLLLPRLWLSAQWLPGRPPPLPGSRPWPGTLPWTQSSLSTWLCEWVPLAGRARAQGLAQGGPVVSTAPFPVVSPWLFACLGAWVMLPLKKGLLTQCPD